MKTQNQLRRSCSNHNPVKVMIKVKKAPIPSKKSLKLSRKKIKTKEKRLMILSKLKSLLMAQMMRKTYQKKSTTIKKSKKEKHLCCLNKEKSRKIIQGIISAGSSQGIIDWLRTKKIAKIILLGCNQYLYVFFMC